MSRFLALETSVQQLSSTIAGALAKLGDDSSLTAGANSMPINFEANSSASQDLDLSGRDDFDPDECSPDEPAQAEIAEDENLALVFEGDADVGPPLSAKIATYAQNCASKR